MTTVLVLAMTVLNRAVTVLAVVITVHAAEITVFVFGLAGLAGARTFIVFEKRVVAYAGSLSKGGLSSST